MRTITITRIKDGVASDFEATDTTFLDPGDIIEVRTIEAGVRLRFSPRQAPAPTGRRVGRRGDMHWTRLSRRKEHETGRTGSESLPRDTNVNLQFNADKDKAQPMSPLDLTPLRRTVFAIFRNWKLIAGLPLATILLTATGYALSTPRYIATAVLQVGLIETEPGSTQPLTAETLSSLEIRDSRLLESEGLAHKVVLRHGLDKLIGPSLTQRLRSAIGFDMTESEFERSRLEKATAGLMNRLSVRNEARSNLIQVSVTDISPENAAMTANAVIAEFVHAQRLKKLSANASLSRSKLGDAVLVYGDRHPAVTTAKSQLALEEQRLEADLKSGVPTETELAATGFVELARPATRTAGLGLITLLSMALLGGLTAAVAIAVALEWQGHHLRGMFGNHNWAAKGHHDHPFQ